MWSSTTTSRAMAATPAVPFESCSGPGRLATSAGEIFCGGAFDATTRQYHELLDADTGTFLASSSLIEPRRSPIENMSIDWEAVVGEPNRSYKGGGVPRLLCQRASASTVSPETR